MPQGLFEDPHHERADMRLVLRMIRNNNRRRMPIAPATRELLGPLLHRYIADCNGDPTTLPVKKQELFFRAVQAILGIDANDIQRDKIEAKLLIEMLRAKEREGEAATTITVVEDESWYGNNAHSQTAEAAALPSADPNRPGPV